MVRPCSLPYRRVTLLLANGNRAANIAKARELLAVPARLMPNAFQPGHPKYGGRQKGTRNRVVTAPLARSKCSTACPVRTTIIPQPF